MPHIDHMTTSDVPVENKNWRVGWAPVLNPKKSTHKRSSRQRLTEDLLIALDEEPEGTVSAEQQALADAEENAAADAQRIGIAGNILSIL